MIEQAIAKARHVLTRMGSKGDGVEIEWDPEVSSQVRAARATFDALKKEGMSLWEVDDAGTRTRILTEFDPEAGKIVAVPRMAGG